MIERMERIYPDQFRKQSAMIHLICRIRGLFQNGCLRLHYG